VSWPEPRPGLVIRYSYLWRREALAGQEEGVKDRPRAVILAIHDEEGGARVYAVPIIHSLSAHHEIAIEIPPLVKLRLGLGGERSWVVVSEANVFVWPGPDLRPVPGKEAPGAAYGFLPPGFFRVVRNRFIEVSRRQKAAIVGRTE